MITAKFFGPILLVLALSAGAATPRLKHPVVGDTVGLGSFLDSLRKDLGRSSLEFFLSRLAPGFTGSPRFGTAKDSVKPLRSSAELRRETALFLSWMLEPGRSSLPVDDGTGIVGVTGFDSTPCDPDRGEAMDNYCVGVPDPTQELFDSIGGMRTGSVDARWVHRIEVRGGRKLKSFPWRIRPDWMKVRTPDGRIGWTSGATLDDILGASLSLTMVHTPSGWKIFSLFAPY